MKNSDHFKKVALNFAQQYDVDLKLLDTEENLLKERILDENSQLDAIDIYSGKFFDEDNDNSAFIPDIEDIDFSRVPIDTGLIVNRVEQNLEEAFHYLSECSELKRRYSDVAKLRSDTRFKFLEFVRLDSVHIQEIEQGLFQLPWIEANDEARALAGSLEKAKNQETTLKKLLGEYISDQKVNIYVKKSAQIARNTANDQRDTVEADSEFTSGIDKRAEQLSWRQKLSAVQENIANIEPRLDSALRKEEYLRKDEFFRARRAEISRKLAWQQIEEHSRRNSPINYDSKLRDIKQQFSSNLFRLIERVKIIEAGLRSVYGINLSIGVPDEGAILNACILWLNNAKDSLSKHMRHRKLIMMSGRSSKIEYSDSNNSAIRQFKCLIEVDMNHIPKNSLLRGLAIEFIGNHSSPISVMLTPPAGAAPSEDSITMGRICGFDLGLELNARNVEYFWNGSVEGRWEISGDIDARTESFEEFLIHFWLSSFQ